MLPVSAASLHLHIMRVEPSSDFGRKSVSTRACTHIVFKRASVPFINKGAGRPALRMSGRALVNSRLVTTARELGASKLHMFSTQCYTTPIRLWQPAFKLMIIDTN